MSERTRSATAETEAGAEMFRERHRLPLALASRPALLLTRIGALFGEIADEELAGVGLSGREYAVLAILADDGPESQLELAALLGKAPAMVVASIDALEDRGLVERVRDPADRRRSRVRLTRAGKQALSRADRLAARVIDEAFAGLDRDEREELAALLARGLRLDVG